MKFCHFLEIISIILYVFTFCRGDNQICMFHKLKADCRWRIDGIAMAHITGTVNECSDPPTVTFTVKTSNPEVEWSHSYTNAIETYPIPGFDKDIRLQVKLRRITTDTLEIEADFHVDGWQRVDFLWNEVQLTNPDNCEKLNLDGKIAVGVLSCLVVIAGIILAAVLGIRNRRKKAELQNRMLVNNATPLGLSNPPPYSETPGLTTPPPYTATVDGTDVVVQTDKSTAETDNAGMGSVSISTDSATFSQNA